MQNIKATKVQDGTKAPVPRLAYSMHEAAQALGISYISVWRLVQRGKLRAIDALRHKLIPATELERFLK